MSQGNSTTYNHILTQEELDELQFQHKYNVLQYDSNKVKTSAARAYANTINNGSTGRTFATQSHSYTNPNTLNLQRWGYTATNNGGQVEKEKEIESRKSRKRERKIEIRKSRKRERKREQFNSM